MDAEVGRPLMSYEAITFERRGHVALVTMNRPDKLNAVNDVLQQELRAACAIVEADDEIRVMILTGAGRGFCSGADLNGSRPPLDPASPPTQVERMDEFNWGAHLVLTFGALTKPTIAAVNGVAAGAGLGLALSCDLRVGAASARFKTVFAERSMSPDTGVSYLLPRVIGYSRAVDMIFTSRTVEAEEAYRLGILDRLAPDDRLIDESLSLAEAIAKWPPMAIRSAKRVTLRNLEADLEQSLRNEIGSLAIARLAPHDVAESLASFRERREPHFTGE